MALALLDFQSADHNVVRLAIDTGVNTLYRYKIGQSVANRDGMDWVDNITYTSPMMPAGKLSGDLLNSGTTIQVPAKYFSRDAGYIQLFTFKNAQGTGSAISKVLQIPVGMQLSSPPPFSQPAFSPIPLSPAPFSRTKSFDTMALPVFYRTRRIACPVRIALLSGAASDDGASLRQGKAVSEEFELADMTAYRAFWNKIWESPVLDSAELSDNTNRKYGWELNVNGKYFIMLTASHDDNGLMETRLLTSVEEKDSVRAITEGRMKAGIELSIKELNKLIPVMGDKQPLTSDQLRSFLNEGFARDHSMEFIYHFRLQGKAGQRGMIWVIPIFKLFEFTLTSGEKVCFPLPVSARSIGLKSE